MRGDWITPDRLETLDELLKMRPRLSARELADRLGITKNALMGYLWRNRSRCGIGRDNAEDRAARRERCGPIVRRKARRRHESKAGRDRHEIERVPQKRTCQWPLGDPRELDFHFCGEEICVESRFGVYCAEHEARAWRKAGEPYYDDRADWNFAAKGTPPGGRGSRRFPEVPGGK